MTIILQDGGQVTIAGYPPNINRRDATISIQAQSERHVYHGVWTAKDAAQVVDALTKALTDSEAKV